MLKVKKASAYKIMKDLYKDQEDVAKLISLDLTEWLQY